MEDVTLTASHWIFLLVILTIFVFIIWRKDVVLPSIIGIFLLGILANSGAGPVNALIASMQVIFNALLNAGEQLFDIMLVIALMVAMLKSLQAQGADVMMVTPMRKMMVNPWTAFFVLGITMYIAATFFWPTPAVAIVGVVLIPVAMQVGLPAMAAAVAINLFGHGIALSGDLVIQGATSLTASSAGLDTTDILPYTALFSFTVGLIAIAIAFYTINRDMKSGVLKKPDGDEILSSSAHGENEQPQRGKYAKLFAILVPVVLFIIVALMIYRALFDPDQAIRGGDATGLLGGSAVALLTLSTFSHEGSKGFEKIVDHLREGFFFAIKIFAPIIPIAGFFFLGHPDHAEAVLGEGTPGFLFDIGTQIGHMIEGNVVLLAFGIALIGLLTGMDGSGFSGLPLVGGLSASLGGGAGVDVAVLASLGQVAAIFAGGGTLAAWAFGVAADAGIAGVKPADLVRRNFIPVMIGTFVACIVAIMIM